MRPVDILPITPDEYDENFELIQIKRIKDWPQKPQQGQQAKPTKSTKMTVQTVNDTKQGLIDKWVKAGAPTEKKSNKTVKKWDDPNDEKMYDLLYPVETDGYRYSRRALIDRLGQFCSYCETPVFSHLHVEHRMPKNSFPSKTVSWANFLISCPTCNAIKGDSPNQQTPLGLKPTDQALTYNTDNYYWPQAYWSAYPDNAPFPFKYELKRLGAPNRKWEFGETIPMKNYERLTEAYQNGTLRVLDGKMAIREGMYEYYLGLELSWSPTLSQANRDIIDYTLELTDQNKLLDAVNASTSINRRIELRTITFFKARVIAERLSKAKNNAALYNVVLKQAKTTMEATGFWGVWFHGFRSAGFDSAEWQTVFRSLFLGTAQRTWA